MWRTENRRSISVTSHIIMKIIIILNVLIQFTIFFLIEKQIFYYQYNEKDFYLL